MAARIPGAMWDGFSTRPPPAGRPRPWDGLRTRPTCTIARYEKVAARVLGRLRRHALLSPGSALAAAPGGSDAAHAVRDAPRAAVQRPDGPLARVLGRRVGNHHDRRDRQGARVL